MRVQKHYTLGLDNGGDSGAGYWQSVGTTLALAAPRSIPPLRLYRLHSNRRLSEHRFGVYSPGSALFGFDLLNILNRIVSLVKMSVTQTICKVSQTCSSYGLFQCQTPRCAYIIVLRRFLEGNKGGRRMKARAVILAGGEGTRLSVLTAKRAKPAVPFAGKSMVSRRRAYLFICGEVP